MPDLSNTERDAERYARATAEERRWPAWYEPRTPYDEIPDEQECAP